MEADITSQAVGLASNTDFSLMQLFIRADFVVKSVIIILIACSIYSWAVIIEKFKLFKKINNESENFEDKFWKSKSAETFYNTLPLNVEDPMSNVFKDSMQILLKSKSKSNLNDTLKNFEENVLNNTGKIKNKEDWGLRDLSYVIKNFKKAFYKYYQLEIDGSNVKNITRVLNQNDNIIRHLFIRVNAHQELPTNLNYEKN